MYVPTGEQLGVDRNLFMVGYNGAVVFEMNAKGHVVKSLFETKMSAAQVEKILKLSDGLAVEYDLQNVQYARRYPGDAHKLLEAHISLVQSSPTIGKLPELVPGKCEPNKITVLTSDPAAFVAK